MTLYTDVYFDCEIDIISCKREFLKISWPTLPNCSSSEILRQIDILKKRFDGYLRNISRQWKIAQEKLSSCEHNIEQALNKHE